MSKKKAVKKSEDIKLLKGISSMNKEFNKIIKEQKKKVESKSEERKLLEYLLLFKEDNKNYIDKVVLRMERMYKDISVLLRDFKKDK